MAFAIILPNVLFGMLHWRSAAYAAIAGVVGVYFGLLFLWTGNLLAPILAHAAYDAVALWRTRQAIAARRISRASPGRAARV
jgi:membrane protease YdiL (CAAX protease family)